MLEDNGISARPARTVPDFVCFFLRPPRQHLLLRLSPLDADDSVGGIVGVDHVANFRLAATERGNNDIDNSQPEHDNNNVLDNALNNLVFVSMVFDPVFSPPTVSAW